MRGNAYTAQKEGAQVKANVAAALVATDTAVKKDGSIPNPMTAPAVGAQAVFTPARKAAPRVAATWMGARASSLLEMRAVARPSKAQSERENSKEMGCQRLLERHWQLHF